METQKATNGSKGRLAAVTRGRLTRPVRVVLFSVDKLGKSTWAANAPDPIFIGPEDGTAHLDVARLPPCSTWTDVLESAHELVNVDHRYKTAVLDTADWCEPLLWAHIAKLHGKKSIEELPYGKGYTFALDEWRKLLSTFDALRDRRSMNVIVLAHSWIRLFKNPEGEDFDRYEMKLHAKASGLLREWADAVLFGNYETLVRESDGRKKGVSTGARCIYTQRTAAWDAGNRFGLPEVMPLEWAAFAAAIAPKPAADIRSAIEAALALAPSEVHDRVRKAVTAAGDDASRLSEILNHIPKAGAR